MTTGTNATKWGFQIEKLDKLLTLSEKVNR